MGEQENPQRSLSVPEVAARLGVAPVTVYRHLKRGTLPSFHFGGVVRVLEADLNAFITRQRQLGAESNQGQTPAELLPTPRGGLKAWAEIVRPFSWTASLIPVTLAGAIAWKDGAFSPLLFLLALLGALLLQAGTNVINELFDVRQGVDTPGSARASKVLVQDRLRPDDAYRGGLALFGAAMVVGAYLITVRGFYVVLIGLLAILIGYFYTASPIHFKYRGLGVPVVFVVMGPLMVVGTYFVLAGTVTLQAAIASLPVGILVATILHANDVRDVQDDAQAPFKTLSTLMGQRPAGRLYMLLLASAYLLVILLAGLSLLPLWTLLTLLTLPLAGAALYTMQRALRAGDEATAVLATIDVATAKVHLTFGLLLSLAFILQGALG
ncbi:MAG: UbiA family prenyltransferase [Dehalococcoidia bacterium]